MWKWIRLFPDWGWGAAGFGGPKGGSKTPVMKGFASTKPAMLVDFYCHKRGTWCHACSCCCSGCCGCCLGCCFWCGCGCWERSGAGVSERMLLKGCCLWRIINKASLVNPNVLSGDLLCCCIFLVGWINKMIKGCVSNKSANMLINCLSLSLQNTWTKIQFLGIWQTWTNDSTYPPRSFVRCPMPPVNLPLGLF